MRRSTAGLGISPFPSKGHNKTYGIYFGEADTTLFRTAVSPVLGTKYSEFECFAPRTELHLRRLPLKGLIK